MADKTTKPEKKEPTWDEIGEQIGRKIEKASEEGKFDFKNCHEKGLQCKIKNTGNCGGFGYFLGFLGALVYYWGTAPGIWEGVIGFFKALFWPGFLIYGLLKFIGA